MFALFFLQSCKTKIDNNNAQFIVVDSVIFDLGFQLASEVKTIIQDNVEYIGFANFITNKKLSIFDIDGNFIRSIKIDSVIQREMSYFCGFHLITLDSIALLSNHANKVVVIDTNSKTLFKKDYYPLLIQCVELFPPFSINGNSLRVAVNYLGSDLPANHTKEDYINSNGKDQAFYNLLFDTAFYKQEEPLLQLDSIYSRFANKNQITGEGNHILMTDSLNIYCTAYSDSLYVFDMSNNLIRIVPVKSKFSKTKLNPITHDEYLADNTMMNKNFWENGFIDEILWDKYRKLYYCFVRDAIIEKTIPFSIIVFDENFNNLGETKFDQNKYLLSAFIAQKGLYIMNNKDGDFRKLTYTIFRYGK